MAFAYGALADAHLFLGDPMAAAEAYGKAVELSDEAGEALTATYGRAEVAMALTYAEHPDALALADEALAILYERGDQSALAFGLYIAGEVRLTSDPARAQELLEEAIALARRSGNRLVSGAAGLSHLSLLARRDPRAAMPEFRPLIEHWLRIGLWPQLWTTMRLLIEALAAVDEERTAARLLGAQEATDRSGTLYGADERRRADLLDRLEASLGGDELQRLLADGRTLDDEAAVDEALGAVDRVLTA
jgi:hypothetical protein